MRSASDKSTSACTLDSCCSPAGTHPDDLGEESQYQTISTYPQDNGVEKFVEALVPSHIGYPQKDCCGAFSEVCGNETTECMHEHLVNGFQELVEDFPAGRMLRFFHNTKAIPFPYASYDDGHRRTAPDLVASFPAARRLPAMWHTEWTSISLAIVVEPLIQNDPISYPDANADIMRRLLKTARNLLVGHVGLFAFVIGIFGCNARLFRVDHAGATCSPEFNYIKRPEVFRQFLWKFVHPLAGTKISGDDPTVSSPTAPELRWARNVLGATQSAGFDLKTSRWIKVKTESFLTVKLLHITPALFSRASIVWSAIARGDKSSTLYVLKDSWREGGWRSETAFHTRIANHLNAHKEAPFGLARMVVAFDLGAEEDAQIYRYPSLLPMPLLQCAKQPGQRTLSSVVNSLYTASADMRDRRHTRLVTDILGTPLSEFHRTKEMVEALHDAIRGHQQAYNAGVLQRDVSDANVMMADDCPFKGFIHDFDYSCYLPGALAHEVGFPKDSDILEELMNNTGTPCFMAIERLEDNEVIHAVHHDLESFFWLLIWLVLRHTRYTHSLGNCAWVALFPLQDNELVRQKRTFISADPVVVDGNVPLTYLLKEFTRLACLNQPSCPQHRVLTYDAVLDIFTTALDIDSWPGNDSSLDPTYPWPQQCEVVPAGQTSVAQMDVVDEAVRERLKRALDSKVSVAPVPLKRARLARRK